MAGPPDEPNARERTDHSLRDERKRSDDELVERSEAVAEHADDAIRRAREGARIVLDLAREREDALLSTSGTGAKVVGTMREARRIEDAALQSEHATADAQRLSERERRYAAVLQLLALERDATDRTLAAERIASDATVRERDDRLSFVAHDIRNILHVIIVNASTIVLAPSHENALRGAAAIQRAGAAMTSLMEDLLDLFSHQAGRLAVRRSPCDVVDLVRDAVSIHEAVATENAVTLRMEAPVDTLTLQIDGRRITRLLSNLLANALKYTPSGGRVDVRVSILGDECEIAVHDTGIGIPAEQLHAIFERFQQGLRAPERDFGVGLGLYIARLITDAHGGRIWAESEGAGSTFRVRLPLATAGVNR